MPRKNNQTLISSICRTFGGLAGLGGFCGDLFRVRPVVHPHVVAPGKLAPAPRDRTPMWFIGSFQMDVSMPRKVLQEAKSRDPSQTQFSGRSRPLVAESSPPTS